MKPAKLEHCAGIGADAAKWRQIGDDEIGAPHQREIARENASRIRLARSAEFDIQRRQAEVAIARAERLLRREHVDRIGKEYIRPGQINSTRRH